MGKSNAAAGFLQGFVPTFIQTREKSQEKARQAKRDELEARMKDIYAKNLEFQQQQDKIKADQDAALGTFISAIMAGQNPPIPPGLSAQGYATALDLQNTIKDRATKDAGQAALAPFFKQQGRPELANLPPEYQRIGYQDIVDDQNEIVKDKNTMKHIAASKASGGANDKYIEFKPGVKLPATAVFNAILSAGMSGKEYDILASNPQSPEAQEIWAKVNKPNAQEKPEDAGSAARDVSAILGLTKTGITDPPPSELAIKMQQTLLPQVANQYPKTFGAIAGGGQQQQVNPWAPKKSKYLGEK